MNKNNTKRGLCPKQGMKEYEIEILYLDASTNEGADRAKNGLVCRFRDENRTGCTRNDCPIYASVK
jgi:hypothetical protein